MKVKNALLIVHPTKENAFNNLQEYNGYMMYVQAQCGWDCCKQK